MTPSSSRRSVVKGAAWAVPAVAVSAAAPAFAASRPCELAVDAAFARYPLCNGQPWTLDISFDQVRDAQDNGQLGTVEVNITNTSACAITFSDDNPLVVTLQVRNNNTLNDGGRTITGTSTAWGTVTGVNYDIANKQAGSVDAAYTWTINEKTLSPRRQADLQIDFGGGAAAGSAWNSYLTVDVPRYLPTGAAAPTFQETGATDSRTCRAYYDAKLKTWSTTGSISWTRHDVLNGTPTAVAVSPGQQIDSRVTGNFVDDSGTFTLFSSTLGRRDGIW